MSSLARNLLYRLESLERGGWRQRPERAPRAPNNGLDAFTSRRDKRPHNR